MSIRLRLTLTYTLLLMIILIALGASAITVLHWVLLDSMDRQLDETANEVIDSIEGPIPTVGLPTLSLYQVDLDVFTESNIYIQVWNLHSILIDRSDNLGAFSSAMDARALVGRGDTYAEVAIYGTPLRVLTRPIIIDGRLQGRVQVASSMDSLVEAVNRVALIMIVGGLVSLAAALLVIGYLLGRALRPIESIAATASQITTGDDLSRRIPYDGPADELGKLTTIFNSTLDRLEKLFRSQRRFVADVSHELRTPLTVVQANIDLIKRYGTDPESLAAMESETKRMARLVEDLLLLAQADAGKLPLRKEIVELDTVVMEVFKQAERLDRPHAAVVFDRFEPVRVEGDYDRLKQLLINLVGNALKYTPVEGKVRLSVWPSGKDALIAVADTGEGIPAEDQPHIFDRFYRVDKARARASGGSGGSGLGLSIAQWIAEAHGGQLTLESAVGSGTTFTLRLPAAPTMPVSLREDSPPPAGGRIRNGAGSAGEPAPPPKAEHRPG